MPLEIVGAGFGRTGTNSLKLALEHLGFGPCHHMHEVAAHPDQVALWLAAAQRLPVEWEQVFAGYRSQLDWPGARYWRQLAAAHPAARVILTVRPAEAWCRSFLATVGTELLRDPDGSDPVATARRRMQRLSIVEQVFGGGIDDPAHLMAVIEAHNAAVRDTIAPERLLVLDVAEVGGPCAHFSACRSPTRPSHGPTIPPSSAPGSG